jgi:hypothetical protein
MRTYIENHTSRVIDQFSQEMMHRTPSKSEHAGLQARRSRLEFQTVVIRCDPSTRPVACCRQKAASRRSSSSSPEEDARHPLSLFSRGAAFLVPPAAIARHRPSTEVARSRRRSSFTRRVVPQPQVVDSVRWHAAYTAWETATSVSGSTARERVHAPRGRPGSSPARRNG